MKTGNWGGKGEFDIGVSGPLDRQNYTAFKSSLTRFTTRGKDSRDMRRRQIHPTQRGYVCPAEKRDGDAVGIVNNTAVSVHISSYFDEKIAERVLLAAGVAPLRLSTPVEQLRRGTKVFLNGNWIGIYSQQENLATVLRAKRGGELSLDTSIVHNAERNEIHVWTDRGRFCRPLLRLRDDKAPCMRKNDLAELNWSEMCKCGFVEYVSPYEEDEYVVALRIADLLHTLGYTHVEICEALIFGIAASNTPFANHNESMRNMFYATQSKQAMAVSTLSGGRFECTTAMRKGPPCVLRMGQKPLVRNAISEYTRSTPFPTGANPIVAIICNPYNNEDAIIICKASLQFGLFDADEYSTHEATAKENQEFQIPDPTVVEKARRFYKGREFRYDRLDSDGVVEPGMRVGAGDCIIGLVERKTDADGEIRYIDRSVYLKDNEGGYVHGVQVSHVAVDLKEGEVAYCRRFRVKIRSSLRTQTGDKFSSRHGQKGVIGSVMSREDMPYTKEGMTPDIIINPHAFPSRMTIGQLIEMIVSKATAASKETQTSQADGTPFSSLYTVNEIEEVLKWCGYQCKGEVMYDGATGRRLEGVVCIGPTFYERLAHVADMKLKAMRYARTVGLTRQPTRGRANNGGLRFGEMERDCALARGAMATLQERLFLLSDPSTANVCRECGSIVSCNSSRKIACLHCGGVDTTTVHLPYAMVLLTQELACMGIKMSIETKPFGR